MTVADVAALDAGARSPLAIPAFSSDGLDYVPQAALLQTVRIERAVCVFAGFRPRAAAAFPTVEAHGVFAGKARVVEEVVAGEGVVAPEVAVALALRDTLRTQQGALIAVGHPLYTSMRE